MTDALRMKLARELREEINNQNMLKLLSSKHSKNNDQAEEESGNQHSAGYNEMDTKKQNFKCSVCNKICKKKIYLNKHYQEIHKINCKGEQLVGKNKFYCEICGKTFTRKNALQHHITSVHFPNSEETKKYKCNLCTYFSRHRGTLNRHLMKHKNEETMTKELFECNYCDAGFQHITHLKRHYSKVHAKSKVERKCPICPFKSVLKSREEIRNHFEQMHAICLKWKSLEFESMDAFNAWRKKQEKKNKTCYTKRVYSINCTSYVCHRSGVYQAKGQGIRSLKMKGSAKINGFCPAEIKINTDPTGRVYVKYLSTHVGHKNDVEHLRLSKEEKEIIASQIVNKIPHDEILLNIRNSITGYDLQRYHLINKKDIKNIENSFNLNKEAIRRSYKPLNADARTQTELPNSRDTALLVKAESGECKFDSSREFESAFCQPDLDTQLNSYNMQGSLDDTVGSVRSRDEVEGEYLLGLPVNEEDIEVNIDSTQPPNADEPEEDNQSRRVKLYPENIAQVKNCLINQKMIKSELKNKPLEVLPNVIVVEYGDHSGHYHFLQTCCPNPQLDPFAQTPSSDMSATGKPGLSTNNNIGKADSLKPPAGADRSPDTLTVSLAQFEEPTKALLRERINELVSAVTSGNVNLNNLIFASVVSPSP